MIGAIKRRWKSKKAKVLHKGSDLSVSSDSCPTSRGFAVVDGCEDFEKLTKPPSPRQIHPEKGDGKFGRDVGHQNHHHHPLAQHHHPYNAAGVRKKSSTLPSSDDGCPFIRVNSGRIELVSNKESSSTSSSLYWKSGGEFSHQDYGKGLSFRQYQQPPPPLPRPRQQDSRRRGPTNDSRHSWCGGSAVRDLEVAERKQRSDGGGATLLFQQEVRLNNNNNINNKRIPAARVGLSQELSGCRGSSPPSPPPTSPPLTPLESPPPPAPRPMQAKKSNSSSNNVTKEMTGPRSGSPGKIMAMSPLKERLAAIEEIASNLQNWQMAEKVEYERCVSDLASQVSRAVALQQLMKSEVEKLQARVVDLENHNKAMATMIIPTLMKLHDTVGPEQGSQSLSSSLTASAVSAASTDTTAPAGPSEPETSRSDEKASGGGGGGTTGRKSPKHRKIDCRIPRISSRPSSRPSGSPQNNHQVSNERKGDSMSCSSNDTSPSSLSRKSPAHSNKMSNTKSCSFSGIPRMSSPRPSPQRSSLKDPRGGSPKNNDLSNSSTNNSSRLPIRRNLPVKQSEGKVNPVKSASNNNNRMVTGKIVSPSQTKTPSPSVSARSSASPPITSSSASSSSESAPVVKLKLNSNGIIATGKDEGYSTMSSEALAEQEKNECGRNTQGIVEETGGKGMHKSNTFNTFCQISDNNYYWVANNGKTAQLVARNTSSLPAGQTMILNPASTLTKSPRKCNNNNVRIVRGIPYELEEGIIGETGGEEPASTSTILWEDSDDSDILFLPLEISSGSSSRSTLVPPTETKLGILSEDRALIEKWMRLEDVRNEVQWDDEWAWDWDGVQQQQQQQQQQQHQGPLKSLRSIREAEADDDKQLESVVDDDEDEFWFQPPPQLFKEESLVGEKAVEIDSSTWTKTKCGKIKSKLLEGICLEENGQSSPGNRVQLEEGDVAGIAGDVKKMAVKAFASSSDQLQRTSQVSVEQEGLLINEQQSQSSKTVGEDGVPPVIEFTPEYYHLVNYGSYLSFSDNESNSNSPAHESSRGNNNKRKSKSSRDMDDKVSQTDFASSQENMSASSELFSECRNCLEMIKKLVAEDTVLGGTLDKSIGGERNDEVAADPGCPTTWISVPKGLPTTEVDRILDILSSSESEDILSPAK